MCDLMEAKVHMCDMPLLILPGEGKQFIRIPGNWYGTTAPSADMNIAWLTGVMINEELKFEAQHRSRSSSEPVDGPDPSDFSKLLFRKIAGAAPAVSRVPES